MQIWKLSRPSRGMPPHHICQLYNMVAVPAITYAAEIWYTEVHTKPLMQRRSGSVATTNKLLPTQWQAAKVITGMLSTTAAAHEMFHSAHVSVFCNGSGFEGGVRAPAVAYIRGKELASLTYHLSGSTDHGGSATLDKSLLSECDSLH
ncbi:hypothetical protein J132_03726 [Termitomyces sp. J132]|nr:hypothetical protein J132_03726 [Termitomyces sp. J132]